MSRWKGGWEDNGKTKMLGLKICQDSWIFFWRLNEGWYEGKRFYEDRWDPHRDQDVYYGSPKYYEEEEYQKVTDVN